MFSMLLYFKYYEQLHSKDNLSTLKSYFLEQLWTSGFWSPVISIKKSFVTVADCRQPLTVVRKSSVLDFAWFLDPACLRITPPYNFLKVLCLYLYCYVKTMYLIPANGMPANGASNSCHGKLCYFETAGSFYAKLYYYTLCFPFGTC